MLQRLGTVNIVDREKIIPNPKLLDSRGSDTAAR